MAAGDSIASLQHQLEQAQYEVDRLEREMQTQRAKMKREQEQEIDRLRREMENVVRQRGQQMEQEYQRLLQSLESRMQGELLENVRAMQQDYERLQAELEKAERELEEKSRAMEEYVKKTKETAEEKEKITREEAKKSLDEMEYVFAETESLPCERFCRGRIGIIRDIVRDTRGFFRRGFYQAAMGNASFGTADTKRLRLEVTERMEEWKSCFREWQQLYRAFLGMLEVEKALAETMLVFPGETESQEEVESQGETEYQEETGFPGETDFQEETGFPRETGFPGETDFQEETDFRGETGFPGETDFQGETELRGETASQEAQAHDWLVDIRYWSRGEFASLESRLLKHGEQIQEIEEKIIRKGEDAFLKSGDGPSLEELKERRDELQQLYKEFEEVAAYYKNEYEAYWDRIELGDEIVRRLAVQDMEFLADGFALPLNEDAEAEQDAYLQAYGLEVGSEEEDFRGEYCLDFETPGGNLLAVILTPRRVEGGTEVYNTVRYAIEIRGPFGGSKYMEEIRSFLSHVFWEAKDPKKGGVRLLCRAQEETGEILDLTPKETIAAGRNDEGDGSGKKAVSRPGLKQEGKKVAEIVMQIEAKA